MSLDKKKSVKERKKIGSQNEKEEKLKMMKKVPDFLSVTAVLEDYYKKTTHLEKNWLNKTRM